MGKRLDRALFERKLTTTKNQASSYIKLGFVTVNDKVIRDPAYMVNAADKPVVNIDDQYVSRAGLKLDLANKSLRVSFKDKIVLDVGSSTGGFTDYALKNMAKKIIAVEIGKDQLHPSLRLDKRIELYEQTDINDVVQLSKPVSIVVIDVSFVSLRKILPKVLKLTDKEVQIIVLFKPQFEAESSDKHEGVIKNDRIRRRLMHEFESWLQANSLIINGQVDSEIPGSKGNQERFYLLKKASS